MPARQMLVKEKIQEFRFPWEGREFAVGISIGMVAIDSNDNLSTLLSNADSACYAAKEMGRNRVHIYEHGDKELVQRKNQMAWASRIQESLDKNRFRLYYQCIAISEDHERANGHFEILLRMVDEDGELVPPGAFIPAAERYSLMSNIDRWVVDNVFKWLDEHQDKARQVNKCAINLSGDSLGDERFFDFVKNKFSQYKVKPEQICFEITETVAITNLNKAISFISDFRTIGCSFALDDFGTGLSSFGYLKNLQVDYLKIDGAFIKRIDENKIDYAMVESINNIGHVIGLKTIAEYVENQDSLDLLKNIGIDYVQGYFVHKPEPISNF